MSKYFTLFLLLWTSCLEELKRNTEVATMIGFSIIGFLKSLNMTVDTGSHSPNATFLKLINKRIKAVALQSFRGDWLLKSNPEYASKIKKIKTTLEKKPYYLMLSKQLVESNPNQAKLIWVC